MTEQGIRKFDKLIEDKSNAAIVMRQHLKPVEGENAIIFPPTYAGIGYNIDSIESSRTLKNVCIIDSVGSQANRMESVFKEESYCQLIPRIKIEIRKPATKNEAEGELLETIDLLDAGHRIADAVARFSDGANDIEEAFQDAKKGNVLRLSKLSPTSLVFGCWDSRGSAVKLPRIVRSTIRALNVHKLTRSAQYVPATECYEYTFEKLGEKERKKFADAGLGHVPSTGVTGGVILDSDSQILRESVLSLSALRALHVEHNEIQIKLRRYIFGLSLVAFTALQEPLLRMGCELTADPDKPTLWEIVSCDGKRINFTCSQNIALEYAQTVSEDFGIDEARTFTFDPKKATEALKKDKDKNIKGGQS